MADTAIRVDGLGKRYRIGARASPYATLRESLYDLAAAPARRLLGRWRPEETIWALRDVSFEVKRGEVVGVIGRNGAGKSTLLKILSRITEPTEGRAEIRGRVGSLLEVGTGFHPELTGRENVYLNGAVLGMTRKEIGRKFDDIVSFAEIEKFMDTPVKRYSSGMYLRLAFAVAAHLEPEIMLVDEVLAVGDAAFQRKCLGKMGEVAGEGRTVLFVSHNVAAVRSLCSSGVYLDSGRIAEIGPAERAVGAYLGETFKAGRSVLSWKEGEGPGDGDARLLSVRLSSGDGEPRSEFGNDEPILLAVEYALYRRLSPFRVGASLYTADGTYVFYSSDDDVPEYAGEARGPGRFLSTVTIPPNLLNAGSYVLRVGGGLFGLRTVFEHVPPLDFTVLVTGGAAARFNEQRRGILSPALGWQVRDVEVPPPQ